MEKFAISLVLVLILVKSVELKFFNDESDNILRDLINYNSAKIKQSHDKIHDYYPEPVYYSPFQTMAKSQNFSKSLESVEVNVKLTKRSADTKFRGKPKSIQVDYDDFCCVASLPKLTYLFHAGSLASKLQFISKRIFAVKFSYFFDEQNRSKVHVCMYSRRSLRFVC
jgi:hypothetical protein